jgi:60 kDa SS-A/Ro ribonucleoprotein
MTEKTVLDSGYTVDEYTAAKYQQRNKDVSLHDVINLVRPNPRSDNRDYLFGRIVKGELDDNSVDALREDRTWEAERSSDTTQFTFDMSSIELGSEASNGPVTIVVDEYADLTATVQGDGEYVSHEYDSESDTLTVDVKLTERQEWITRLDDMGLMARVRNLRNMLEAGLSGDRIFHYDIVGVGPDGAGGEPFGPESKRIVENSKMFPFRFYQAYKACGDTGTSRFTSRGTTHFEIDSDIMDSFTRDWLNGAIDASTSNLPETLDNTFTAIDLSGSMDHALSEHSDMTRAEVGVLFGSMLMKRGSDAGAFGTDFAVLNATEESRASTPTLDVAKKIYSVSSDVGNSTNAFKTLKWMIEEENSYDTVVIFTDEQVWDSTGGRFSTSRSDQTLKEWWDTYVSEVNSEADLFVVDLASYGDLSMPEGYQNVHQVSGWSDNIIDFIDKYKTANDVVSDVEKISPDDY